MNDIPFKFENDIQLKIYKSLIEIDQILGKVYLGALQVLRDSNNPDRISQSAHSIREILNMISRKAHITRRKGEKDEKTMAEKIKIALDPYGAYHNKKDVYKEIVNDYHSIFTAISHHGKELDLEKYKRMIKAYEEFLINSIFAEQRTILKEIDNLIKNKIYDVKKIQEVISINYTSHKYFFENIDSTWVEFLHENDFFNECPEIKSDEDNFILLPWPESKYLLKVAKEKPKIVIDVISKSKVPKNINPIALDDFIDIAKIIPTEISKVIIKKINRENWLNSNYLFSLPIKINEFLKIIIHKQMYEDSIDLIKILLNVKLKDSPENKQPNYKNVTGYINNYEYKEVLDTLLIIPDSQLKSFIKTLIKILCKAIEFDVNTDSKNLSECVDDNSYLWRPAIEDSEQNWNSDEVKELLVECIRELLTKYIQFLLKNNNIDYIKELNNLLENKNNYCILERLKICMYTKYKENFIPQIEGILFKYFDNLNIEHEYKILIMESFGDLPKATRDKFINFIESQKDKNLKIENYILIKKFLNEEQKVKYLSLLNGKEEPEISLFPVSWGGIKVGPTSPVTREEIMIQSINEIVNYLISWVPNEGTFQPSEEGFGRNLEEVVEERAEEFSKNIIKFLNNKIKPVYIYHLFSGLEGGLKKGKNIYWEEVFNLIFDLIEKDSKSNLPIFSRKKYTFEADWDSVFKSIVNLIRHGLDTRKIQFIYKNAVFKIIEYFCKHPEPSIEYEIEYGGNNLSPFALSVNTVRGISFHCLFLYIQWYNFNIKQSGKKELITNEVKKILEKYLNPQVEPTLTIRSVYGRYFPWLLSFDNKWTMNIKSDLFPENDLNKWYAAWETYLSNMVYKNAFNALKSEYQRAINELGNQKPKRRYWIDPTNRLVEHIMLGYLFGFEDKDNMLFKEFYKKNIIEQKSLAINFVGRNFINYGKEKPRNIPEKSKIKKIWEIRLRESDDIEELKEFGWWIKKDFFDNKWMLSYLVKTLEKTNGLIENEIEVIQELNKTVENYPLLTINAIKTIIKSKTNTGFLNLAIDEIKSILRNVLRSKNIKAIEIMDSVINHMIKLGFEDFRDIAKD